MPQQRAQAFNLSSTTLQRHDQIMQWHDSNFHNFVFVFLYAISRETQWANDRHKHLWLGTPTSIFFLVKWDLQKGHTKFGMWEESHWLLDCVINGQFVCFFLWGTKWSYICHIELMRRVIIIINWAFVVKNRKWFNDLYQFHILFNSTDKN